MRRKWLTYLYTGITTAALAGGAAFGVYRYQSGSRFTPKGQAAALQENKVSFDEEDGGKLSDASASEDGSLLEKDPAAEDRETPAKNERANMLFERPENLPGDAAFAGILDPNTVPGLSQTAESGENQPAVVYDLRDSADTVSVGSSDRTGRGTSHQDNAGASGYAGGSGSSGSGGSSGSAGSAENQGETQTGGNAGNSDAPTPTPEQNPDPNPNPEPTPTPAPKPSRADTVRDPEPDGKVNQGTNIWGDPTYSYAEDKVADTDVEREVIISYADSDSFAERFYHGQSVTAAMLYNAMATEVMLWDDDFTTYTWGAEDLDRYVRVDAVSFDDGESWQTEFPVTVPASAETMQVRMSYRFRTAEDWTDYEKPITIDVADGRVFVLSRALEEDAEQVEKDSILNLGSQYLQNGETLSLYQFRCIGGVLAENDALPGIPDQYTLNNNAYDWENGVKQTKLFSGWLEDGEVVSWDYLVAGGRHILEPGAFGDFDQEKLDIRLKQYWFSRREDGSFYEDLLGDSDLYYVQTLCGFSGNDGYFSRALQRLSAAMRGMTEELAVPEYTQAIDFDDTDDELEKLYADHMQIPASVCYIDTDSTGLRVEQGYSVDEENRYYSAEDGVLYNKAKTELLAVPYLTEELSVPTSVEKVQLSTDNRLCQVTLEAETAEMLPTLSVSSLRSCRIVLQESVLLSFAQQYAAELRENGDTLAVDGDEQGHYYYIEDNCLIRDDGMLYTVFPTNLGTLSLPDGVSSIGPKAFSQLDSTEVLQLNGCEKLRFAADSFRGSSIRTILCRSEAQLAYMQEKLTQAGITDIELMLSLLSREGYCYLPAEGSENAVVLLSAPKEIPGGDFDGTVTALDGTALSVQEIADGAFRGSSSLRWAELPDSVEKIGNAAFENCTALEGILIGTPGSSGSIEIGDGALDGCTALRFAASNVPKATMVNDYDPLIMDWTGDQSEFFVPIGAEGYGSNATSFDQKEDVAGYTMLTVSEKDDARVLYALNAKDAPWLALRSGNCMAGEVKLPESTEEIYICAFAETESSDGGSYSLTIQPAEDGEPFYIDDMAFYGSSLGGRLMLPDAFYVIGSGVFAETGIQTAEIDGSILALQDGAFYNCLALESVSIESFDAYDVRAKLHDGLFNGCENFRKLTIRSGEVPGLSAYIDFPFQLNHDWTQEEECERIELQLPAGTDPEAVALQWRYGFAGGYTGESFGSPYLDMWRFLSSELIDWDSFTLPEDEEVDRELKNRLLEAENRVRQWIGADPVDEPTAFYPYREEGGMLKLIGAPSYVTELTVDAETLALPEGAYLDTIGSRAFAESPYLRTLTVPAIRFEGEIEMDPAGLSGIERDAFSGIDASSEEPLTLRFADSFVPELLGGAEDISPENPFSFGIEDTALRIEVPAGTEEAFIERWQYPLTGYTDREAMLAALAEAYPAETEEALEEGCDALLLPAVNRLRQLLGLAEESGPTVTSLSDIPETARASSADIPETARAGASNLPKASTSNLSRHAASDGTEETVPRRGSSTDENEDEDEKVQSRRSTDSNIRKSSKEKA